MNQPRDQLDVVARRIIGPLVASRARRRTMHEELLAHLHASYEEELARRPGADVDDAIAAAARRLGDPTNLRRQLQSSVPLAERLFFQLSPQKENPMSRWLWLLAVCAFLVGTSIVLPILSMHKHQGIPWSKLATHLAIGLAITFAGLGTILYGVAGRLRRRRAAA